MNAIEIRQLVKQFGDNTAVDKLDLTVPFGTTFAFLGPNGAGKTTTLRIMTGLAKPTSGSVMIDGVEIGSGKYPPIGYLPDTPNFYHWMTPRQFLAYIAQLHHLERPAIDETLERVGLLEAAKKRVGGFSRGMKQRLGLAQALLAKPRVLLLDEPVSALDPAGRKDILDILSALRGQMTVFFSTHILNDAERICDEVAILNKGRLVLQADREALLARYVRPVFEVDTLPDAIARLNALAEHLKSLEWVERVETHGAQLRVFVRDVARAQHELLPMFVSIPVTRFEMLGATLEDVFLTLTRSGEEQSHAPVLDAATQRTL
ncbi:MAG: ABC transporter ATP-binding protein [Anaerolineae bacterium]